MGLAEQSSVRPEVYVPGFVNQIGSDEKEQYIVNFIVRPQDTSLGTTHPKILLEYISANPTGPLHIGHGRWAAYGSTLAKILRFSGRVVTEEFYVNDVGSQIQNLHASVTAIRNNQPIPETGYHGAYLQVFKANNNDPLTYFLNHHQATLRTMGVTLGNDSNPPQATQHFYRESQLREPKKITEMLEFLAKTGLSYQSDKATWFASQQQGSDDKDRVIVKSDGSYTYFFMDILYHFTKLQRGHTHLIDILGSDHHGYTERITTACKLLYKHYNEFIATATIEKTSEKTGPSKSPPPFKMDVIIGQLVNLYQDGKPIRMSKRTGNIIELHTVLEEIGVDASRYFLLQQNIATTLEFDLTQAKQKSMDNPVFYIQYAHARIQSIFTKAKSLSLWNETYEEAIKKGEKIDLYKNFDYSLIASPTLDKLLHKLLRFKDELNLISKSYEVHHLPRFLHGLATHFHKLYNETPFLATSSTAEQKRSQCYLVFLLAVDKALTTGLDLMGISHPDTL